MQEGINQLVATIATLQTMNGNLQIEVENGKAKMELMQQTITSKKTFELVSTIPSFGGSAKENIKVFLTKIEQAAKIAGWDQNDKLSVCKRKLEKDALEFILSDDACKEATTFAELQKILVERYKKKNTVRYYREQLATIKKKEIESFEEFGDRIRSINAHTYELIDNHPELNNVIKSEADQRALDAFLNGISGEIAEKTKLAQPKTFSEAVANAVMIYELLRNSKTDKMDEAATKQILATSIPKCSVCKRNGHTAQSCRAGTQGCYNCGMLKHWASTCRRGQQRGMFGGRNFHRCQSSYNRGRIYNTNQNTSQKSSGYMPYNQYYSRGRGQYQGYNQSQNQGNYKPNNQQIQDERQRAIQEIRRQAPPPHPNNPNMQGAH
jgi:hypothetical protein